MRLYKFLDEAGERPYREPIQHHIERDNAAHLGTAGLGEVELLPDAMKPRAASFVDTLNERLLTNRRFWQTATCRDALNRIVEIANEHFGLSLRAPADPEQMSGVDQELAFGLFAGASRRIPGFGRG